MKNQTVENLKSLAVKFAEEEDKLKLACDIEQSQGQSPTEVRWRMERQYPDFKYSNSDLALQEAERVARQG